jgi:hypothetical protein
MGAVYGGSEVSHLPGRLLAVEQRTRGYLWSGIYETMADCVDGCILHMDRLASRDGHKQPGSEPPKVKVVKAE